MNYKPTSINSALDLLCKRKEKLKKDKSLYNSVCSELNVFFEPHIGETNHVLKDGTMISSDFITPVGTRALNKSVNIKLNGLMNSRIDWIQFTARDSTLQARTNIQRYLDDVSDAILSMLNMPALNFYASNEQVFRNMEKEGTGALMILEQDDKDHPICFKALPIRHIYIDANKDNQVDTIFIENEYTPRVLIQMFGEDGVSEDVKEDYLEGCNEPECITQVILPSEECEALYGIRDKKPFTSIIYEDESKHILELKGFYEFPVVVGRPYRTNHELWSRSSAWIALHYVKQITFLTRMKNRATQLIASPPILAADDGLIPNKLEPFTKVAGAISPNGDNLMQFMELNPAAIQIAQMELQQLEQMVEKCFGVSSLPDPTSAEMTTLEVRTRSMDELQYKGTEISAIITEYIDPLLHRVFNIMERKGLLPDMPKELKGKGLKINYCGYLANVHRYQEVNAIQSFIQLVAQLGQIDPNVLGILNLEKSARLIADITGVEPDVINSEEEIAALKAQQQQAQQAQVQAQQLQAQAQALNVMANTQQRR